MGTITEADWKLDGLGDWSEPTSFDVDRERIVAYAEATNDEHPAHRAGDLAPPVFSVVPAFEALFAVIMSVVPEPLRMRGVHGQQLFEYHRPIEPGLRLLSTAAPMGVAARSTGAVLLVRAEVRTEDGQPVTSQAMTYFVRGAEFGESVGEDLPQHPFPEQARAERPVAQVEHGYDEDQTFRYSEAAGDPMEVHLDDELARKVGLPGIIVHGLCTLAFCSRAVVGELCSDDPTRLGRLAARFSSVVQPSERVTTSIWDVSESNGCRRLAFETASDNGNVAISDGFAELAER